MAKKALIDLQNPERMSWYTKNKLRQQGLLPPSTHGAAFVPPAPVKVETDDEIRAKLKRRFETLDKMTHGLCQGIIRSMIVSGPAGVGKSFKIDTITNEYEEQGKQVTRVKGHVRATGLYRTLLANRGEDCIVVFDDADAIFGDETSLNLLKAACDTTKERNLSWLSETKMETEDGDPIDREFTFNGSIIFITNYDFEEMIARGSKLAPHFEALISRSLYVDLAMKTKRDYLIRIQEVIKGSDILKNCGLNKTQGAVLVKYFDEHYEHLRELSLRMVIKLAGLMVMDEDNWQDLAKVACYKYP